MTVERAFKLMQETLDGLLRSGVIDKEIVLTSETVLLGSGSGLDSLGLVAWMTDLEDRFTKEVGEERYLILTDIHEFNESTSKLDAMTMARYLVTLAEK